LIHDCVAEHGYCCLEFRRGSCWIGAFDEGKVKQLLKIPEKWKVVALVTFGYPAEQPKSIRKKTVEELFGFNCF